MSLLGPWPIHTQGPAPCHTRPSAGTDETMQGEIDNVDFGSRWFRTLCVHSAGKRKKVAFEPVPHGRLDRAAVQSRCVGLAGYPSATARTSRMYVRVHTVQSTVPACIAARGPPSRALTCGPTGGQADRQKRCTSTNHEERQRLLVQSTGMSAGADLGRSARASLPGVLVGVRRRFQYRYIVYLYIVPASARRGGGNRRTGCGDCPSSHLLVWAIVQIRDGRQQAANHKLRCSVWGCAQLPVMGTHVSATTLSAMISGVAGRPRHQLASQLPVLTRVDPMSGWTSQALHAGGYLTHWQPSDRNRPRSLPPCRPRISPPDHPTNKSSLCPP